MDAQPETRPDADQSDVPDPFAPFRWHPEPQLIGLRDAGASRAALEQAGAAAWRASLDWLYGVAAVRATGTPTEYGALRSRYFGESGEPGPAPATPQPLNEVLDEFAARIAPHTLNSYHPRTLSYLTPPPLVASIAGEVLAQWTNQGVDVWQAGPVGAFVEEEVLRWLCDLVGYDGGSFGLCTSGGEMANFIAMTLARDIHLRRLRGSDRPPRGIALEGVRVYTGDQAHFSIARALDELGFLPEALCVLPTDDAFRLRSEAVTTAIADDRSRGILPIAVCAVAGSMNTGSVDPIPAIAAVAAREGLWLHVDAAYGGAARLSARDAERVPGLDFADSVTVDPHKWFFQAYDLGALLVKDGSLLQEAFDRSPEYYRRHQGHTVGEARAASESAGTDFYRMGFEGSRRLRALKLWASWKHLGSEGLGRLVERTNDTAAYLSERCAEADDFEVPLGQPDLSVVCLRHLPGGSDAALTMEATELDAHQTRLAEALAASGDGWLSTTVLGGRTYLRAGVVNYLTGTADIDRLLDDLRRLGSLPVKGA